MKEYWKWWLLINYLCADNSIQCWRFVPAFPIRFGVRDLFLISLRLLTAANCCWLFLIVPDCSCAVLQRLSIQFKIDLSNFLILVDRVANWGKLRKAIFRYFMVIEGFSSSKDISDLRVTSGSWDSTLDFIKDHRGKIRGKFSWNFLHQVIVIVREWTIGLFRS